MSDMRDPTRDSARDSARDSFREIARDASPTHSRESEARDHASPLDDSHVAELSWRILAAARRAGGDAMSDLATHLAQPNQAREAIDFAIAAPTAPLAGFGPVEQLLTTQCGIEVLRAMKVRAKRDLGLEQLDPATRRAGLLAFGLSVAAMLVQHRTLGTRASADSIEELLLVLCGAEVPWIASLGAQALVVLGELGEDKTSRIA
jgi:hypothetical protein